MLLRESLSTVSTRRRLFDRSPSVPTRSTLQIRITTSPTKRSFGRFTRSTSDELIGCSDTRSSFFAAIGRLDSMNESSASCAQSCRAERISRARLDNHAVPFVPGMERSSTSAMVSGVPTTRAAGRRVRRRSQGHVQQPADGAESAVRVLKTERADSVRRRLSRAEAAPVRHWGPEKLPPRGLQASGSATPSPCTRVMSVIES